MFHNVSRYIEQLLIVTRAQGASNTRRRREMKIECNPLTKEQMFTDNI